MAIFNFVLELSGAIILLLFAVRMVRTGIMRAYGASFRRIMTASQARLRATFVGVMLAIIMQSSVAVAVLVAGFVSAGGLSFQLGLSAVLGAELGLALIIQFLSMDIDWLASLLLVAGGILFLRNHSSRLKQIGRVCLGVALILIALEFIRHAAIPIHDNTLVPQIYVFLEHDFLTAFILGAVLTFLMHSSVASVLLFATLVMTGTLPLMAGISLMLGANLGSALLPVWLSRSMQPTARHIPVVNALLKGGAAAIMVVILNQFPIIKALPDFGDGQTIILGHILFNLSLLVFVPFSGVLGRWIEHLWPKRANDLDNTPPHHRSVLDAYAHNDPELAIIGIRREIQRMLTILEEMFLPVIGLVENFDKKLMKRIVEKDVLVNEALDGIRYYIIDRPAEALPPKKQKDLRHLLEFAIALESAGDVISGKLLKLATARAKSDIRFSVDGLAELKAMHDQIVANMALANNLLISEDVGIARHLLEEKNNFTHRQRKSRKNHLTRLAKGLTESLESSDLHLEIGLAFKEFNSHISSIAYPTLSGQGQLLESRLVQLKSF